MISVRLPAVHGKNLKALIHFQTGSKKLPQESAEFDVTVSGYLESVENPAYTIFI